MSGVDPSSVPADPKPIPADPKPIPANPKPIPADPKPIPADPKPIPADPDSILVDPNADDSHSNSDYDTGSSEFSTESLSSSVYKYRYENGRRYHAYKDGKYALPNDEVATQSQFKEWWLQVNQFCLKLPERAGAFRLDIIHHVYLLMMNHKLHLAPIGENPQRVLDIGTGTGIWAIDMAERYPSAEVIGTDLSPIQPSWVPPNAKFEVDDAESDWTWDLGSFDFIHIRHLSGAIKDWSRLLRQAIEFLKPGGYIEVAEYELNLFSDDGTVHKDLWLWKFYELINEAAVKSGREFIPVAKIKPALEELGYEDIKYQQFKLPIGTWPADRGQKEIGAYALLNAETAYDAHGMALFTRVLGMDVEKAREVVIGAEKDVKNRKIHTYSKQHLWWARKPMVL